MTIYFYKAEDSYGCFSNFSYHPIYLQERNWPTVEHYYQSQKVVGTPDSYLIEVIRQVSTPREAAKIGRESGRIIRRDWEKVKISVMYEAVFLKFLTHEDIQKILLETGDEDLVENSPVDYFWGCGLEGTGQNHLGKILMRVRREIQLLRVDHSR